ncbi:MAG: HD domain-containing protein [Clostridiales bacterium]|nr:HD domain-containing protein [Clostridiales bacterium]
MLENFDPSAKLVLDRLTHAGFVAYLVGGSVRDCLMGMDPGDIDVTTSATPDKVKEIFSGYRVVETGIKHGTVTVVIDKKPVEITTFRSDGDYSDNRHPDSVAFSDNLEEDVRRRDFTINSIAVSPDGEIVDYEGGADDIKKKRIACIGDPDKRFSEDALRILRALRFSSVLDFSIDKESSDSIHRNKELLQNVSAERISAELKKLICGAGARKVLLEYSDVIAVIMPEIEDCIGFEQLNHHHIYDVYTHSVIALSHSKEDMYTRMALLLHDIGKPATATFDEEGEQHFYSHPKKSAEISDALLRRLRFPNSDRERIVRLVAMHDTPMYVEKRWIPSSKRIRRIISQIGVEDTKRLIDIHKCDNMAQNSDYYLGEEYYESLYAMVDDAVNRDLCLTIRNLNIDGNDLIKLGYEGEHIGHILREILKKVLNEEIKNEKEDIIEYLKNKEKS